MAYPRVSGGRINEGLVRLSGPHCLGHFIVDFKNDTFGVVFAVLRFLLFFEKVEGFAGEIGQIVL
jgi:hypothetical protein